MDLLTAFIVFLVGVTACLALEKTLIYALLLGLICFMAVGRKRGFTLPALVKMAWDGGKTSFPVLRVLVFIGCLTALWRASGTIPFFVYYGIKMITPRFFILIAFLLTAALSFGIGTSFGTAGTAGVVLMILARSGGVNELITAGAVMSGAYFGERCSPASSSSLFAVTLSGADSGKNLKMMLKTSILPTLVTIAVYGILSWKNPIRSVEMTVLDEMGRKFSMSWMTLIPAAVLLSLALSGVKVMYAVAVSAFTAGLAAAWLQGEAVKDVLIWAVMGYKPGAGELSAVLSGGGIISMKNVLLIVIISSTYSGIFRGTGMLDNVHEKAALLAKHTGRFGAQIIIAVCSGGLFCNQTIGIIMAEQLLGNIYENSQERAADICNSIIMIAGLIPWSIAATGPLAMLGVGTDALVYSVLLYMVPMTYLVTKKWWFSGKNT